MRWRLRDAYFNGKAGACIITVKTTGGDEQLAVEVDQEGYFELAEPPKTFAIGIFAKTVG